MKRLLIALLFALPAFGQNVPYSDITLSSRGTPVGGAPIGVCGNPGLATTAAQVISNIAVLTMSSNPITAGFVANQAIAVSGFTGADTYFNGGTVTSTGITNNFLILSVTSTQITYSLVHANASATTNGFVFQAGSQAQACAPLSSIFNDAAGASPITQPGLTSTGLGNYQFYAAPNSYYVQFFGATIGELVKPIVLPLSTANGTTTAANLTVTGYLGCKNINNTRCVDTPNSAGWPGVDACAQIASAQTDIATTGGTIDARGLIGTQAACAGTLTIGGLNNKPVTLLLGGSVLTVQNTITVNGASLIQGAGSNSHGPFPTRIIAGASFPTNTTLVQFDNTQVNFDIRLMNLEIDCSNVTGCRGLDTGQLQDGGLIQDVWITSYGAGGSAITGACINTGSAALTENWIAQEVTCIRSTTAAVTGGDISLNGVADHFTLTNTGCGTATGSTSNACIQCNNCNLVATALHEENATDGVLFTGNAAAGGTSSISELDCLNNVTNCLHIASNFNGNVVVNAVKKNSATNAWKNDVVATGVTGTCTDENAGFYQFSFNNLSVFNSCSAAGMGSAPGQLFTSNGFQVPAGSGFIITDNTASHVQKVGIGPNVTGNDQTGFFSYTAGRDVFHCQLLAPFSCGGATFIDTQGSACTNGELLLSAGWQSTGTATVTAVAGSSQTCSWTITTGTTTAANPTVTDTLVNALPNATTVCEMNIHGGTHTAAAGEGFQQTTLSATAPVFTFNGTPTAGGTTYFVTRRCGP